MRACKTQTLAKIFLSESDVKGGAHICSAAV